VIKDNNETWILSDREKTCVVCMYVCEKFLDFILKHHVHEDVWGSEGITVPFLKAAP
jgi:hypothetical protein